LQAAWSAPTSSAATSSRRSRFAINHSSIERHTAADESASAGVSSICKAIAARTHRAPADHARLVTGNYDLSIIGNHAELCGMPPAREFRSAPRTITRKWHVPVGCDVGASRVTRDDDARS